MRRFLIALVALPLVIAWPAAHAAGGADAGCSPGSGRQLAGDDLRSSASELPAELRCANLAGARLDRVDLTQKDLRGAVLRNASLRGADLTQASLQGADLEGADLSGATLGQAHLTGANASRANLSHAGLSQADLVGADLSSANLPYADLGQADLTRSNLTRANLAHADLSQATLTSARLDGADVSRAQVVETQGDPASTAGMHGRFPLNELALVLAALLAAALAANWLLRDAAGRTFGRLAPLVGALLCGFAIYVLASLVLALATWVVTGFGSLLVPDCAGVTCVGGITRSPVGLVAVLLLGAPGLALGIRRSQARSAAVLTFDGARARVRSGIGPEIALIAAGMSAVAVVVAAQTGSGPIVLGLLVVALVLAALSWARRVAAARSTRRPSLDR